MRGGGVIGITPGDVIDLTEADVTFSKFTNSNNLRIVLRTERKNGFITLFAQKEAIGLKRAKVVSIDQMFMSVKKYNKFANKQFVNVYVTLEDTQEIPTLYAENNNTIILREDDQEKWKRPSW